MSGPKGMVALEAAQAEVGPPGNLVIDTTPGVALTRESGAAPADRPGGGDGRAGPLPSRTADRRPTDRRPPVVPWPTKADSPRPPDHRWRLIEAMLPRGTMSATLSRFVAGVKRLQTAKAAA